MSRILIALLALVITLPCRAQDKAPDASALLARLHAVEQNNSLDDRSLKPWHLKLEVQIYDTKGNPGQTATVEEWWAAPNKIRVVFTSPDYIETFLHNPTGYFRTTGVVPPLFTLDRLLREVVHPMPSSSDLEGTVPDLRKQTIGKTDLDCVMLDLPLKDANLALLGFFPTYCLGRDKDVLRITYDFGTQTVVRNSIGTFQGRSIPVNMSSSVSGTQAATARISVLQTTDEAAGRFSEVADLTQIDETPLEVKGEVVAVNLLRRVAPQFPQSAKVMHEGGSVVLGATIGTDGHIYRLRIVSTPRADLALAAYAAVRQWVYKPYLSNGGPATVNTTITVNFNFGPVP